MTAHHPSYHIEKQSYQQDSIKSKEFDPIDSSIKLSGQYISKKNSSSNDDSGKTGFVPNKPTANNYDSDKESVINSDNIIDNDGKDIAGLKSDTNHQTSVDRSVKESADSATVHKSAELDEYGLHKSAGYGLSGVHKSADFEAYGVHKSADYGLPAVHKSADIRLPSVHKSADFGLPTVHKSADYGANTVLSNKR